MLTSQRPEGGEGAGSSCAQTRGTQPQGISTNHSFKALCSESAMWLPQARFCQQASSSPSSSYLVSYLVRWVQKIRVPRQGRSKEATYNSRQGRDPDRTKGYKLSLGDSWRRYGNYRSGKSYALQGGH